MEDRDERIRVAADRLWDAGNSRTPCEPVRSLFDGQDLEIAYAIQQANCARRLRAGTRVAGRKIGLTSKAVRDQLGIQEPDYGVLHADTMDLDGCVLDVDHFIRPKIEGEIAFVLGRAVDADTSLAQMLSCIEAVGPAFEIVDSRMAWDVTVFDSVADNACYARTVLGPLRSYATAPDLSSVGMTVLRNGEPCAFGTGYASMGNPLTALRCVMDSVSRAKGRIEAGEVILSGALGQIVDVRRGDLFELDLGSLGRARTRFA